MAQAFKTAVTAKSITAGDTGGNLVLPASGLSTGDLGVLAVLWNNAPSANIVSLTALAGWTLQQTSSVGNGTMTLWTKPLTSADHNANVNIAFTANTATAQNKWVASCVIYSGVDNTTPIGSIVAQTEAATLPDNTHPVGGYTINTATEWDCVFVGDRASSASSTFTLGASHTKRATASSISLTSTTGTSALEFGDSNGVVATGAKSAESFTGNAPNGGVGTVANAISIRFSLKAAAAPISGTATAPGQVGLAFTEGLNWSSDTIKAMLVDNTFTLDVDAHRYIGDAGVVAKEIANGNGYLTGGVTLGTKTRTYLPATNNVALSAAALSWTATVGLQFASPARGVVIYKWTGANGTSPILGYIDFGSAITVDGLLTVAPDATYGFILVNTV